MNSKKKLIFLSLILITGIFTYIIKTSYAYMDIYEIIEENSILVGETLSTGYVSPNDYIKHALDYYKNTNNKNIKMYKYSGIDEDGNPIWGVYNDDKERYVKVSTKELKEIEKIIYKKLNSE